MESIDYDRLMQANAARVFSERDPTRRLAAIDELYTADAVVAEPEVISIGAGFVRRPTRTAAAASGASSS